MQGTYRVLCARVGLVGLVAALVLLVLPGTSIAGGVSGSTRSGGDSVGLLQRGAGYGTAGTAAAKAAGVKALQRTLGRLGWQPGPVDGLFGPRTEAAVLRFQRKTGLTVDGVVGPKTRRALESASTSPLREGAGYAQPDGSPRVRTVQAQLHSHGFAPGPVDGLFGPRTHTALVHFQRQGKLPVNGVVTQRTQRLLANAGNVTKPAETVQTPEAKAPERKTAARVPPGDRRRVAASVGTTAVGAPQATAGTDSTNVPLLITTGLLALLVGALAGAVLRRMRPQVAGTAMPLAHTVVAEGWARTRSIGPFRGRVHALVLAGRGLFRKPETRYLISDPRKKGPFWVTHEEVSRLVAPPPSAEAPTYANGASSDDEVQVVGYVSVRDTGQLESVHLHEQADAIASLCGNRGWRLVEVVRDTEDTRPRGVERPGLQYALERIGRGEASCLVVSQLGRLSNSAADLGRILEWLGHTGGRLVAIDVELDTASPDARVAVNALAAVGTWEREPVVEPPEPHPPTPVAQRATVGQAGPLAPEEVPALKERIATMRQEGMTLQAIADRLNEEGVPTLRGGTHWRPSSVRTAASSSRNGAGHDEREGRLE